MEFHNLSNEPRALDVLRQAHQHPPSPAYPVATARVFQPAIFAFQYRKEAYCLTAIEKQKMSPKNAIIICVAVNSGPRQMRQTPQKSMKAMMKIIVALSTSILLGLKNSTVVPAQLIVFMCSFLRDSLSFFPAIISFTSQYCGSSSQCSHSLTHCGTESTLLLNLISEHSTDQTAKESGLLLL